MGGLSGRSTRVRSDAALHLDMTQICLEMIEGSCIHEQHVQINAPGGDFHQMMQKHAPPHKSQPEINLKESLD